MPALVLRSILVKGPPIQHEPGRDLSYFFPFQSSYFEQMYRPFIPHLLLGYHRTSTFLGPPLATNIALL